MPKISLVNFSVHYYGKKKEDVLAVNNISVTFDDGEITAVVGESGCGKTTILKTIAGLLDYEGDILVDDTEFSTVPFSNRKLSYVDQNIFLYPHFTIYDNIRFPLKDKSLTRADIDKKVKTLALELEISHCLSRLPKHLSIGQCQRAAIAKSLIKEPNILLFDEATSNLDPVISQEIITFLKKYINDHKITTIFVTHKMKEAFQIADKIIVMKDGEIVDEGSPEELMNSSKLETQLLIESGLR